MKNREHPLGCRDSFFRKVGVPNCCNRKVGVPDCSADCCGKVGVPNCYELLRVPNCGKVGVPNC